MKKKSDNNKKQKPIFHDDLDGFDIKVNAFGEIESSFTVDRLNTFLNKEVEDKKLKDLDPRDSAQEEE